MDDMSLTDQFIFDMEKRIVTGEWAVNTMLPSFRKLCSEYNVSRSVINTAVSVLHVKGFVDIIPRRGAKVRNWRKEGNLQSINSAISFGKFEPGIIDAIFNILSFIQCNGVYEAALKAKEEDIIQLSSIIEQEAVIKNNEKLVVLYHSFHKKITLMSGNMAYSLIFMSLDHAILKIAEIYASDESAKQQCFKMHKDIYQSLKERDGQKAKWEMQTLLDHLRVLVTYKTCNLKEN
ncbi:MAG: FCD domain-containing protein [Clostridia bacterium]|jgi:GntR family transcriptional repressor for pyruvate dehydrogenase complex